MKGQLLTIKMGRKYSLTLIIVYILASFQTGNFNTFSIHWFWPIICSIHLTNRFIIQLLLSVLVRCGNYYPCSTNPCGEKGQCIAMYPSPNLQAYIRPVDKIVPEDLNGSSDRDIFFTSPTFSRWEDASEYCISNDASLLDMSINNSILRYISYKY